jgi:hypothetical protein
MKPVNPAFLCLPQNEKEPRFTFFLVRCRHDNIISPAFLHALSFAPAKVVMLMTPPTKAAKPNTAFPINATVLPMAKPTSMATANPIPELRT